MKKVMLGLLLIVIIALPILADEPESPELVPAVWLPLVQAPVVQPYITPTPIPTPEPPQENMVYNGDFERGARGWLQQDNMWEDIQIIHCGDSYPRAYEGACWAWHGGRLGLLDILSQQYDYAWVMPAGYNAIRVSLWYRVSSYHPQGDPPYDYYGFYIEDANTGQRITDGSLLMLTNCDSDGMWHEFEITVINMHWWAGHRLRAVSYSENDVHNYPTSFHIDKIDVRAINYYGARGTTNIMEAVRAEGQ